MAIILDNYINISQQRCYGCKKVLVYTKDDLRIRNRDDGESKSYWIVCPNCGTEILVSAEDAQRLIYGH